MPSTKPPLIVIVGPNASGKTDLAIKLAKKFNGEIISADSRQVYRGLDIGTGKATKKEQKIIKHHLIDVASPKRDYNVSHFKKEVTATIKLIIKKGKLPFLVGGTGFWVQAVVDNLNLPIVKPNKVLRLKLKNKTSQQLLIMLKKLDPTRAKNIDPQNPYRLIRAIEIVKATHRPIPELKSNSPYNVLMIGITHTREKLHKKIGQRLKKRLKQGLISEVKRLHKNGVSWQRLNNFGLEYRFVSLYLQAKLTRQEMSVQLQFAIQNYAKRQMTWFQRDKRIHWNNNLNSASKLCKKFIK